MVRLARPPHFQPPASFPAARLTSSRPPPCQPPSFSPAARLTSNPRLSDSPSRSIPRSRSAVQRGRNIETPGEDPFLSGQYAIEFVKGMQQSADDPGHILASACCKHYVANSMEHSTVDGVTRTRHDFDEVITQQDLIDSYMPPCVVPARLDP
jgi:hypothetical protein